MSEGDSARVIRCLEGDLTAFEELVERYQRPVFNVAFRMVQNYDDARDITQNVFVKAFQNLARFDTSRKFFSWLYRIAVNESLNFLSRRKTHESVDDQVIATTGTPEKALNDSELGQCITGALGDLKPEYRTVVVLRHLLECSYRDISEILEIPEKTVKSRLFTARRLLREILEGKGVTQTWSNNA